MSRKLETQLSRGSNSRRLTSSESRLPDFLEHLSVRLHVDRQQAEKTLGQWLSTGLQDYLVAKHFGGSKMLPTGRTLVRKPSVSGAANASDTEGFVKT